VRALALKWGLEFEVLMKRFRTEMSGVPNPERYEQTLVVFWKDFFLR
jgi:hypothetical protein